MFTTMLYDNNFKALKQLYSICYKLDIQVFFVAMIFHVISILLQTKFRSYHSPGQFYLCFTEYRLSKRFCIDF